MVPLSVETGLVITSFYGSVNKMTNCNLESTLKCIWLHPTGRALTSDWFVNSFIMAVYENFFKFSHNVLYGVRLKKSSHRQPL